MDSFIQYLLTTIMLGFLVVFTYIFKGKVIIRKKLKKKY